MATIILKCTERCNSNCVYCDVVRSHNGVPDMPLGTLDVTFMHVNEFLIGHPDERMLITWHGGEPLLLGAEYFNHAAELFDRRCEDTRDRIEQCIQSNLTLMTDLFIPAFRRLGIRSIGSSYDPDPGIRGPGSEVDSVAYNTAFLRGTSVLERYGMGWGIIYVVTKGSLPNAISIFNVLCNLKPGGGFNMNPVIISDPNRLQYAVSPTEYADFLGDVFPVWYTRRDRYPNVQPFSSLLSNATGQGRRLSCEESGTCARHHMNIDPSGSVSQCGRSSDLGIMNWGNVHEASIAEILQNEGLDEIEGRAKALKQGECAGCKLFPICHGGCPIDGYTHHGSFGRKTGWCAGKKRFVSKYFEPITDIRIHDLEDYV